MTFLAFAESIQLVPDGTLFVHIIILLLMIYVLNRILFKPINRVLDEREQRTGGRSDEAREILHRIDENVTRYEQALREARTQGYHLLEQQRGEALAIRQNRVGAEREKIATLVENEKAAIHTQAEQARATLGDEARQVAASVSTQILGRPVGGAPSSSGFSG
jgi:F-type H+-transporting ATPase subunit b